MFVLRSKYNKLKEDLKSTYEALKKVTNQLEVTDSEWKSLHIMVYGSKGLVMTTGLKAENARLRQGEVILNSRISELTEIIRCLKKSGNQFSKEEIKILINLCHPDKHDGKKSAQEITAKLLNIKANQ